MPSVVRANQTLIFDAAAGQLRTTMHAKILPRAKALLAPPEHKVLSEESRCHDFSCSRVRRTGNDVPIVDENRIIDHAEGCFGLAGFLRSSTMRTRVLLPVRCRGEYHR